MCNWNHSTTQNATSKMAVFAMALVVTFDLAPVSQGAIMFPPTPSDTQMSFLYDPADGTLRILAAEGVGLTSILLESDSGLFRPDKLSAVRPQFPVDYVSSTEILHVQPDLFHEFTFHAALPAGLDGMQVAQDLWVTGSGVATEFSSWALLVVPEPKYSFSLLVGVMYLLTIGRHYDDSRRTIQLR